MWLKIEFGSANKKDEGKRPIAVGEVLRRLASKTSSQKTQEKASVYLRPHQLGVGIRGGCEGVVHTIREILRDPSIPSSSKNVLQIDGENAFNNTDRTSMINEVRKTFPELARYVESMYGLSSILFFGEHTI